MLPILKKEALKCLNVSNSEDKDDWNFTSCDDEILHQMAEAADVISVPEEIIYWK